MTNPWEHFTAAQIAQASQCPQDWVEVNWPRIVAQLVHCRINERDVQIGVIGTVAIESASSFRPVREAFYLGEPEPAEAHRKTLPYYPYYGRGFIQLTHRSNYERYGPKVAELWKTSPDQPDFQLVGDPDRALDPDIAAAVTALYFRDTRALPTASWPQGYSLIDACRAHDWEWVRRLVYGGADPQGTARIQQIATVLSVDAPQLVYRPDAPLDPQPDNWSCSIQSLQFLLRSVGRDPSREWLEQQLLGNGIVTREYGLMDASGRQLASWITREYYPASAQNGVTFEQVLALAGRQPVMVGGRAWNHWSGVRRAEGDVLVLANPAESWMGVGDRLDRGEWDSLGAWSLVTIPLTAAPPAPEPPAFDKDAVVAAIKAHLDMMEKRYTEERASWERVLALAGEA